MITLLRDGRHAWRVLARTPGFTAMVAVTLALGIGASTAIFAVTDHVLLRPLSFPGADRIVTLWNTYPRSGIEKEEVSPPDFYDWRAQSRSFSALAAYERFSYVLTGEPDAVRLRAARVTEGFFAALGVQPFLGRGFLPSDYRIGAPRGVVLTHQLWRSRFGASPSIVGRTVILNEVEHTVLGVMPAWFGFPGDIEIWSPLVFAPADLQPSLRQSTWLRTVGRLVPGATGARALAELSAIARQLERQYPATNAGRNVRVLSLHEETVGDVRLALLVLLGAVGVVLLIACTNVANLLLTRATSRQREVAIRSALGAGRWRLIGQFLTESVMLGVLGGLGGLLLAVWALDLVRALAPPAFPRLQEVRLDIPVLAFALAASLLTGAACGIAPALAAPRADPGHWLQDAGRTASDSRRRRRFRRGLIVIEVALAQVLLVAGGLFFQSLLRMTAVDPGFDPARLLVARFDLFSARYSKPGALQSFYRRIVEQAAAVPGVRTAALSTTIPLDQVQLTYEYIADAQPRPFASQRPSAGYNSVTPDYFRALAIRLLAGRWFTDADRADARPVAIINQTMARRHWPDGAAVGHHIRLIADGDAGAAIEIVGVADDVRQVALDADVRAEIYLPYAQRPWNTCFLLVRSDSETAGVALALRRTIRAIDAQVALSEIRPMEDRVSASVGPRRFRTLLLGVFAALALALAAIGVCGVTAYDVGRRTREVGIRMALGAQRREILGLVVREGVSAAFVGVAIGMVLAFVLTRLLTSLLYETSPSDGRTFATVAIVLLGTAWLACYVPSRRVTKIDPLTTLRSE
jgi:putative ABC transport system permease protein